VARKAPFSPGELPLLPFDGFILELPGWFMVFNLFPTAVFMQSEKTEGGPATKENDPFSLYSDQSEILQKVNQDFFMALITTSHK